MAMDQHTEVPRQGVWLELQPQAYIIAVATPHLSHIISWISWALYCWEHEGCLQCQILSPPSKARDWTHIFVDTSQIHNLLSYWRNYLKTLFCDVSIISSVPTILHNLSSHILLRVVHPYRIYKSLLKLFYVLFGYFYLICSFYFQFLNDVFQRVAVFTFFFSMATPKAYGNSQARGLIGLQLRAYPTATAPRYMSHSTSWISWSLYCWEYKECLQHWIFNPLSKARDWTFIHMDTSWVHYCWATASTPRVAVLIMINSNISVTFMLSILTKNFAYPKS